MAGVFGKIVGWGRKKGEPRVENESDDEPSTKEQWQQGEYVVPPVLKEDGLYAIEGVYAECVDLCFYFLPCVHIYDRKEKIAVELQQTTLRLLPAYEQYSYHSVAFIEACLTGKVVPEYRSLSSCGITAEGIRSFNAEELDDIVYSSVRQRMRMLQNANTAYETAKKELQAETGDFKERIAALKSKTDMMLQKEVEEFKKKYRI